jgi:HSP90 family molecular chaperone
MATEDETTTTETETKPESEKGKLAALKKTLAEKDAEIAALKQNEQAVAALAEQNKKITGIIGETLKAEYEQTDAYIREELPLDVLEKDPVSGILQLRQANAVFNRVKEHVQKAQPNPDPTAARPKGAPVIDTTTRVGALLFLHNLNNGKNE